MHILNAEAVACSQNCACIMRLINIFKNNCKEAGPLACHIFKPLLAIVGNKTAKKIIIQGRKKWNDPKLYADLEFLNNEIEKSQKT